MALHLKTNAASHVNMQSLGRTETAITVDDASIFGTLADGDHFHALLKYAPGATLPADAVASQREFVKVTAINNNTLTVVRGAENSGLESGRTWHVANDSCQVLMVLIASDMGILEGKIGQAYTGETGGSLGTEAARVPNVWATDADISDGISLNGLRINKAGADDNAANLILPSTSLTDSANERTLARKSELATNFVPGAGGILTAGTPAPSSPYPIVGGKVGDLVSILRFGASGIVMATPFPQLLYPPGHANYNAASSIFGGSQNSPSLGSVTFSAQIQAVLLTGNLLYVDVPYNSSFADAKALRDAIIALNKTITTTDTFGIFSAAKAAFGTLNLWDAHNVRGLQQPPVYVASDNASPAATDDIKKGFLVGSRWLTANGIKEFMCLSNTAGAASWKQTRGIEEIWTGTEDSGTHNLISGKEFDDYLKLLFIVDTGTSNYGYTSKYFPASLFPTFPVATEMTEAGNDRVIVSWVSNTSFSVSKNGDGEGLRKIYGVF